MEKVCKLLGDVVFDPISNNIILGMGEEVIPAKNTLSGIYVPYETGVTEKLMRNRISFIRGSLYGDLFIKSSKVARSSQILIDPDRLPRPSYPVDSEDDIDKHIYSLASMVQILPYMRLHGLHVVPRKMEDKNRYVLDLYKNKPGDAVYVYLVVPKIGIADMIAYYSDQYKKLMIKFGPHCSVLSPMTKLILNKSE